MSISKRAKLIEIVSQLAQEYKTELEQGKLRTKDLERPDFLWHALLVAMATMGNARGYDGLIANRENYDRVTFEALANLTPEARLERLDETLRNAKVRMPATKAKYLDSAFQRIVDNYGNPEAAKQELLSQNGPEGKMAFLSAFDGIGPKYARNILMGVYHEEFRNFIAIDARIHGVTRALGLTFPNYTTHEQFYLVLADEVGIEGWDLDQLLYEYNKEIVRHLESPDA